MDLEAEEEIRRDAYIVISDKIVAIKALLQECENIARESGVTFYLDLGQSNYFDGESGIWQSSSSNC